jgi:hypothetical protein
MPQSFANEKHLISKAEIGLPSTKRQSKPGKTGKKPCTESRRLQWCGHGQNSLILYIGPDIGLG